MQITAQYRRDLKQAFRFNARLQRGIRYTARAVAVILLAWAAAAYWAGDGGGATWLAVVGLLFAVEYEAVLWLRLYLSRAAFVGDVEVTVTEHGIIRQTATERLELSWPMIRRIIETRDGWIFRANGVQAIALRRDALTTSQRAELTAFLEPYAWRAASDADEEQP